MIPLAISFFRTFGENQKLKFLGFIFLCLITGIFEILGITLIFPLIKLVSDTSIVERNEYLNWLYRFFGFHDPRSMVYVVALAIGFVFIFKNLYMIFFQSLQLRIIRNWRNRICDNFMAKYLEAPFAFHLRKSSNEIINTLSFTVHYALNSYVFSCVMLLSNIAVGLMLLGFLILQFPLPSIVSGAIMVLMTVAQAKMIRHQTSEINENVNKSRESNLSVLNQAISAIRETKIFRREKFLADKYHQTNSAISYYDSKSVLFQFIPSYVSEIVLVTTIITMCCLILGEAYTPYGSMANLAVLAAVAFRMAPMINRSLFCYSQIRVSAAATQALIGEFNLLDGLTLEKFHLDPQKIKFEESLQIQNVSFSYDGQASVLRNISCEIFKGEFIGIVGPSGAGKTTLADMLLGLLHPSAGSYQIDGISIEGDKIRSLRKLAGYVSQNPYIFNATVRENVAFGIDPDLIDDQKVIAALKLASLDEFFKTREKYINENIGDNGKSLSGGQRQRLAIARALYLDPEIIVLDEATSALDVETEYQITQVINQLKGQKTVIAIAHRLSTLKDCDRIIYMSQGRIVDVGSFQELQKRHADFSRILELSSVKS